MYTMIWSRDAARKLDTLLREEKPDVAHVHTIYHQLSPSILSVLVKHNVPVVMTVHDWNLISCNYVRFHDGQSCSHTLNKNFVQAITHRCVKNSYAASALSALAHYVHKILGVYHRCVDTFIFPSQFFAHGHLESGFAMNNYQVIPNYIDVNNYQPNFSPGSYAVCVGRLSKEKGLSVLLDALAQLKKQGISVPLHIVGGGPVEDELRFKIKELGLEDSVELLGQRPHDEVIEHIRNAAFMVFPSQAMENMPLVVLEALSLGKPVIASQVGGVPELVEHERQGLLFESGNSEALAQQIARLVRDQQLVMDLGRSGRTRAEEEFSRAHHYDRIIELYQSVLKQ